MKRLGYVDSDTLGYIERLSRTGEEPHPLAIHAARLGTATAHEPEPVPLRGTAASRARIHP